MKKTLLALLAAALAGCSGSPNWKEPEMNQKQIVLEDEKPAEQPKTTPKEKPAEEETHEYRTIDLSINYGPKNTIAGSGFDGYIMLLEKDKGKELNDYEKMQTAFKINKDGIVSSSDISNVIAAYAKEKGVAKVAIPFVEVDEDDLKRTYNGKVAVATDEVCAELAKMIEDKTDAEKAKVAEGLRAVYNGKDPLTMKQLRKVQEYLK